MQLLTKIIVAITLAMVAGNPVFAMSQACCCTVELKEEPASCCSGGQHRPQAVVHCHLAGPLVGVPGASNHAVDHDCGCLKTAPAATTSSREAVVDSQLKKLPLALAALVPPPWWALPSVSDSRNRAPGRVPLTGPALQALYCVWQK